MLLRYGLIKSLYPISFSTCDRARSADFILVCSNWVAIVIQFLEGPGACLRLEPWDHPTCDSSLVALRSHRVLESLPASVRRESEGLVGAILLEEPYLSFKAQWLLWLGLEFRWSLNPFKVLFSLLIQDFFLPLRKQIVTWILEFTAM